MENLTDHQERILNKLLGKFGKTDPLEDFKRILQIYFEILIKEDDKFIMSTFYRIIENKLYFVVQKDFRFYSLEYYKEKYYEQLQDFLEDIPDSIESDFIEKCIKDQKSILDNTIKLYYQLKDYSPIDVLTFVSEDFFDEYKSTSKRKIEFLENIQKFELAIKQNNLINEYENPYPDYFKSYGYELFNIFLKEDLNNNNKILAKCSFLVTELRKDNLMCSDFSLKKTFDFLIETFDLNLGKSTKFKTEYSRDKYLPLYNLIKSNFLKD
jgi:hypothetical protein